MKKLFTLAFLLFMGNAFAQNQPQKIDLTNRALWEVYNRNQPVWKDSIVLNKAEGDGTMMLKDFDMGNGTIEFDVKGENKLQQSFVGIAFNIQNDTTFESIYFRPFNFMNTDTARRRRAVQYVSMPDYPWDKLRERFPAKYENKVNPVPNPDGWFHVKVVIEKPSIKVFVNNNPQTSLVVESLASAQSGKIGLWVGNSSGGSFTNLVVTPAKKK